MFFIFFNFNNFHQSHLQIQICLFVYAANYITSVFEKLLLYVKATQRLPRASSLSCLHRFIIIFIDGAICIIVLKLRIVPIVLVHIIIIWVRLCRFLFLLLFLDFLKYE